MSNQTNNKAGEVTAEAFIEEKIKDMYWTSEMTQYEFVTLRKALQEAIAHGAAAEREAIKHNIGFLRQWLNEQDSTKVILNEELERWIISTRNV